MRVSSEIECFVLKQAWVPVQHTRDHEDEPGAEESSTLHTIVIQSTCLIVGNMHITKCDSNSIYVIIEIEQVYNGGLYIGYRERTCKT